MAVTDIIASLLIGVLAGMGVGGGGLLVIYLSFTSSLAQHDTQGLNLLFFIFAALAALPLHLRQLRGRRKLLLLLIPAGLCGVIPGTYIAHALPSGILRILFGLFLIITGAYSLFSKKHRSDP